MRMNKKYEPSICKQKFTWNILSVGRLKVKEWKKINHADTSK